MKKLILFIAAFCAVCGASANISRPIADRGDKKEGSHVLKSAPAKIMISALASTGKIMPLKSAVTDTAFYLNPVGTFYAGYFPNGYSAYPRIIAPSLTNLSYINASKNLASSLWNVNGAAVGSDQNYNLAGYGFGAFYLPTLTTASGASYTYGSTYPDNSYVLSGASYKMPLTNCAMYTSTTLNADGSDCFMIGADSHGSYAYGTDLKISSTKTADTLGVLYENISTMYIDTVVLPIYNSTLTQTMIPTGATLKLTAYAVSATTDGYQLTDKVLGTATASVSDITSSEKGTNYQFAILSFVFREKNALGIYAPKPAVLNGPFYLELTGYNEANCNFGILSDYYYPSGSTYFIINGNMTPLWSSGGSNIAMSLNAIMPSMVQDTTDTNYFIPVSGGSAVNNSNYAPGVFSTFAPSATWGGWAYSGVPDWLTVSPDVADFSNSNFVGLNFSAGALPSGIAGRSAYVTITSLGKSITYKISQGDVTGLKTAVAVDISVSSVNGTFAVTGANKYNSVALVTISGQLLGKYNLNDGRAIIPSGGLNKGVYLLVFRSSDGVSFTMKATK